MALKVFFFFFCFDKFLTGIEIFRKTFFVRTDLLQLLSLAHLECLMYFVDSSWTRRSICFMGPHLLSKKSVSFSIPP